MAGTLGETQVIIAFLTSVNAPGGEGGDFVRDVTVDGFTFESEPRIGSKMSSHALRSFSKAMILKLLP